MLSAFVKNTESSPSILIQDSLEATGSSLLRALTCIHSSRRRYIDIAFLERRPDSFKSQLGQMQDCSVTCHDLTRDHRAWLAADGTAELTDLSRFNVPGEILVVDSLSTLVSRIGFPLAYRQLHNVIRSGVTVICLLHEDCLAESESNVKKLRHLFSTCFRVEKSADPKLVTVVCRHIKKGGRVVRSKEIVKIGEGNNIVFHCVEMMKDVKDLEPPKVEVIPKGLTTFKLDLAPKEKEARDRLVLPYVSRGGGKVFYEPDDADDWDEEDPDEDLQI